MFILILVVSIETAVFELLEIDLIVLPESSCCVEIVVGKGLLLCKCCIFVVRSKQFVPRPVTLCESVPRSTSNPVNQSVGAFVRPESVVRSYPFRTRYEFQVRVPGIRYQYYVPPQWVFSPYTVRSVALHIASTYHLFAP